MTGGEATLADARAIFQVEVMQIAETADGAPIHAHGSFSYHEGRTGKVKSALPPILSPDQVASLMRKHFRGS